VLAYTLLGLASVDATVLAFRHTWTAYDPNEYRERVQHCRRQAWDLVLVGGSAMAEGIDPAQLCGLYWHGASLDRVFNLGLAGATTTTVWHSMERGLVMPPRLLVYGILVSDLNDCRDEPNDVWTLMDLADVTDWLRLRPETGAWCVRHFLGEHLARCWSLSYYRNGIRLWAADLAETWLPGSCPEAADDARYGLRFTTALARGDGFAPRFEHRDQTLADLKAMKAVAPRFPYLENYRLGGHLKYLHRILDWAAARQVAVVLLDMPVCADLEVEHAPAFAAYRAALAEVERSRGVTVLRPTRAAVGLDDTLFADQVHLNTRGRGLMGAWVRAHLAALGAETRGNLHERN
jgi:hypothetical protein